MAMEAVREEEAKIREQSVQELKDRLQGLSEAAKAEAEEAARARTAGRRDLEGKGTGVETAEGG